MDLGLIRMHPNSSDVESASAYMSLTYGKDSTFLLIYIRAGDQLKYVVIQLIIESGCFILAQLQLNTNSCQTFLLDI